MTTRLQFRRDSAANWTSANPVLAQGEPALENDTKKTKLGDGVTAWNSLAYQPDSVSLAATYVPLPAAGTTPGKVATVGSDGISITYSTPAAGGTSDYNALSNKPDIAGQISTAITNLIGGAPGALDTLNELAAAINDDASYAATITSALAALPNTFARYVVNGTSTTTARPGGTGLVIWIGSVASTNMADGDVRISTS